MTQYAVYACICYMFVSARPSILLCGALAVLDTSKVKRSRVGGGGVHNNLRPSTPVLVPPGILNKDRYPNPAQIDYI